jgi:hypothetical protein
VIRTQISLTAEQMARARAEARRRGVSVAALVRDALERLLHEGSDRELRERATLSVGGFHSGRQDISERHDDALGAGARW